VKQQISISNHPIRFLLYLEWILLSIVAVAEIVSSYGNILPTHSGVNLCCLAVFTVMGLKLPVKPISQALYNFLELSSIVTASLVGNMPLVSLMYVVFIARNSLIFSHRLGLAIAILALSLFIFTQNYRLQFALFRRSLLLENRTELVLLTVAVLFGLAIVFLHLLVQKIL